MNDLFKMAEKWLNVPFRWHGRDKNGCDCIGLIIGVLYENKIMSKQHYNRVNKILYGTNLSLINPNVLEKEILFFFKKVDKLEDADLLLIRCKNSPIHFAIYSQETDNNVGKIIHVTQENGKVFKTNFDAKLNIVSKFKLL